jgi:hypothetical protein
MDDVQPDNADREVSVERPDPARLRYWARLIKLLRDPWPPRSFLFARSPETSRSPDPTRQPVPARLGDDV